MKVTLTRDCIIGPSVEPGKLNCAKAGQTVEVTELNGNLMIQNGSATKPGNQPTK